MNHKQHATLFYASGALGLMAAALIGLGGPAVKVLGLGFCIVALIGVAVTIAKQPVEAKTAKIHDSQRLWPARKPGEPCYNLTPWCIVPGFHNNCRSEPRPMEKNHG